MTRLNTTRIGRLAIGTFAAISLLGGASAIANAQDWHHGDNGGGRQGESGWHGDNGGGRGYRQEQSGQWSHQWLEVTPSGGHYYHQRPSYFYHHYRGPEHRRYYTYGGHEFYLNIDTGIRIEL